MNRRKTKPDDNEMIISFNDLIKCGWNNLDNSTIMLEDTLKIEKSLSIIPASAIDDWELPIM